MRIWPNDNVVRVNMETRPENRSNVRNGVKKSQDQIEVEELNRGLKVRTEKPHLVSLGGGRLSTAVTLFPLEKGTTTIGRAEGQDIIVFGDGIEDTHCYIENNCTIITLFPINEAVTKVDGENITKSVTLTQGCMVCLGHNNYFRFNHPEQAMKLKSTLSHNANGEQPTRDQLTKGHHISISSSIENRHKNSSPSSGKPVERVRSPYQDELVDGSFKEKLELFEKLATSPKENQNMSLTGNPHKFSYMNYVGEKLFTKDTNTTTISIADQANGKQTNGYHTSNNAEEGLVKPPKPDVKPKPKQRPRVEAKPTGAGVSENSTNNRSDFKTLSMISTETSIWGSTSSAGTFKLEDESPSPLSCHTPTEEVDVFSDELTSSLTLKHQQMIEERKLEEEMERREQERLEEILAMCAQYEQQVDTEMQISQLAISQENSKEPAVVTTSSNRVQYQDNRNGKDNHNLVSNTPTSSVTDSSMPTSSVPKNTMPSMPDILGDSINSLMSSSAGSDRKNIKTNGSLLHSPTSPPHSSQNVFSYSYLKPSKNEDAVPLKAPVNPYEDDAHLYDCPADFNVKPVTKSEKVTQDTALDQAAMNASIYDDSRIYDSPADIFDLPPPIPAHKLGLQDVQGMNQNSQNSNKEKSYRSVDSSSSELTIVSSNGSYKTAVPELSSLHDPNESEPRSGIDKLKATRSELLDNLREIKSKIMEVENQQNEAVRELEMEQALIQGEQKTELDNLQAQWQESDSLKANKFMIISSYAKQQEERSRKIQEAKEKLHQMEARRLELEEQLRVASDDEKDELLTLYEKELDAYDNQQKVFEDLEFQQLEMEAKYEEESEAVQQEINSKQDDLTSKIKKAEQNLAHMTKLQTDMMEQTRIELDEMERQRKLLVAEFQREKQKMLSLDHRMKDIQRNERSNGIRYSETDDMLLSTPAATLNKELLARLRSESAIAERSKMSLHALPRGDTVMEEERRRLESLKHAATEASILQWHEQRSFENNLRRFGTLDSEEENMSVRSSETPSDVDKISYNSSTDDPDRFSELQQLLAQARYHVQNAENTELAVERRLRVRVEQQLSDEHTKQDELEEQHVQLREKTNPNGNMQRPLTRYLPVKDEEFDLRGHIESIGHNLRTCPFVELTPTKCKGFLLKMGTKMKTWNKRWFVFDREKKALLYYMDKTESKPRGGIYFQSIEDVFVDHMRTVKSPNHKFAFCVKTYDKPYYLVAKSPEALSIWIDVIFTGAEGHQEFGLDT